MTMQAELTEMMSRAGALVDEGRIVQGQRNGHAIFTAEWQHARGVVRFDGQDWSFEPAPAKAVEYPRIG